MSKFEVGDKWVDGISVWINELQLRKVSPRKEKKKRPAYWITTFDDRIALMCRGKVIMTTGNFYSNTSRRNQQAKRWAKRLGLEFRQQ